MTYPTKPLDIEAEAHALLLKHTDTAIKQFGRIYNTVQTSEALAAISELFTRLREVEGERDREKYLRGEFNDHCDTVIRELYRMLGIEDNGELRFKWVSSAICDLQRQLSTSQALLEETEKQRDEALCRLLSAGSEKPTAEDMDWAISMSASLRRKEIVVEQTETEKLKALLEECREVLELFKQEHIAQTEERAPKALDQHRPHTFYRATYGDLCRAASLIERLDEE